MSLSDSSEEQYKFILNASVTGTPRHIQHILPLIPVQAGDFLYINKT